MRVVLVAPLCLAIGFGAGWAVFEQPWTSEEQFNEASMERVMNKSVRGAKDVDCTPDHGPFYSCVVYSSVNGGQVYTAEASRNGRCFMAKATPSSGEEDDPWAAVLEAQDEDPYEFQTDPDLPTTFAGWFDRSDC
jgi:hypothetical protein